MRASTYKLTTAAVCTALAVIMCAMTVYLPLSITPLFVAAFCIFLACKRGGIAYGLICAAATIGLMFLMSGLSVAWIALVLIFAPYGVISYFLHRLDYSELKCALIRGGIILVFFCATLAVVYVIAAKALTGGIAGGIDLIEWVSKLGGYAVFAVVAAAVFLPLDVIFSSLSKTVLKKIPPPATRDRKQQKLSEQSQQKVSPPQRNNYDIFGYEIQSEQTQQKHEKDKTDEQ